MRSLRNRRVARRALDDRGATLVGLALGAAVALGAPSGVASGVFARGGAAPSIQRHRVAVATGPGTTVVWSEATITTRGGDIAYVVAAPAQANVEITSGAWLDALDAASRGPLTPTQRRTETVNGCDIHCVCPPLEIGASPSPSADADSGAPTVVALEIVALPSGSEDDASGWLTQRGYDVSDAARGRLAARSREGWTFVALVLRPAAGTVRTPVVRVASGGPAVVPLLAAPTSSAPLTALVLAPGPAEIPGGWTGAGSRPRALVEAAAWAPTRSVAQAYVDLGVARGDTADTSCLAELSPASLPPRAGAAASALACGALDDLAVVATPTPLDALWLSRLETVDGSVRELEVITAPVPVASETGAERGAEPAVAGVVPRSRLVAHLPWLLGAAAVALAFARRSPAWRRRGRPGGSAVTR